MTSSGVVVIHSARLVSDGRVTEQGWVRFDGDLISAVGTGSGWQDTADLDAAELIDAEFVDAGGQWLTPGFIDIHNHGGGGAAFDGGADAIQTAMAFHTAHGSTRFVLSVVTAPLDSLEAELRGIASLMRDEHRILGSHLEGPFLDPDHRGAHNPAFLKLADPDAVDRLLEAADGTLRQITIAPELPGGMDAVRRFSSAGAAVAVGHTGADYEQTLAAFDAGAS
ncbi:MAG: amidohydrolase family protein, partial [Pseudolysinimonas sp.]